MDENSGSLNLPQPRPADRPRKGAQPKRKRQRTRRVPKPAGVHSLPHHLLVRVLELADDQKARIACMLACRALAAAASEPSLWQSAAVEHLDASALKFVMVKRVRHLTLRTDRPDDMVWILDRLCDAGFYEDAEPGPGGLSSLRLHVGWPGCKTWRIPTSLGTAIGLHNQLRVLEVRMREGEVMPSFMSLPDMPRLERLEIVDETKHLDVYLLDGHYPRLVTLVLECCDSDLMETPLHAQMPVLRNLTYRYDFEESVDAALAGADLTGMRLDYLELDAVQDEVPLLCGKLAECEARTVKLHAAYNPFFTHAPLARGTTRLVLSGEDGATITMNYGSLMAAPHLARIEVESVDEPDMVTKDVRLRVIDADEAAPAGGGSKWGALFAKIDVHAGPRASVVLVG